MARVKYEKAAERRQRHVDEWARREKRIRDHEQKLAGAAQDMLDAIKDALPVIVDEAKARPAPEWDAIVRSFRAAVAKVEG